MEVAHGVCKGEHRVPERLKSELPEVKLEKPSEKGEAPTAEGDRPDQRAEEQERAQKRSLSSGVHEEGGTNEDLPPGGGVLLRRVMAHLRIPLTQASGEDCQTFIQLCSYLS